MKTDYEHLQASKYIEMKLRFPSQLRSSFFWRCVIAEFLSSTIFCYVATTLLLQQASLSRKQNLKVLDERLVEIAFAIGLTTAAVSFIFKLQHGGYINPAITIGHFSCWRNNLLEAFSFLIVQMLGGLAGASIVYGLMGDLDGFMFPKLTVSKVKGGIIEGVLTFIVVLITLASTDRKRYSQDALASIMYGVGLTAVHFVGWRYSGCMLNPARVLGPALLKNEWPPHLIIYWIGPLSGALLAGIFYAQFVSIKPSEKERRNREDSYITHALSHEKQKIGQLSSLQKRKAHNSVSDNVLMSTCM